MHNDPRLHAAADTVPQAAWQGIAAGTPVQTPHGPRAVGDLRAGDELRLLDGSHAPVLRLHRPPALCPAVTLRRPSLGGETWLRAAAGQLLYRDHWLCSALFGTDEVLFPAGGFTPQEEPDWGESAADLVLPVLAHQGIFTAGGFRVSSYVADLPLADACPVTDMAAPLACMLLHPHETRILAQSGVAFRYSEAA